MVVYKARRDTYSFASPYNLVLPMGIEPTSMRFRDACMATMLREQFKRDDRAVINLKSRRAQTPLHYLEFSQAHSYYSE